LSNPDKNAEPVLSHGNRLVTVRRDIPKSVRQVKKSAEEGYPPMYLIKSYESELLRMRVMRDAAFLNANGQEIAMPDMAVRPFAQASVERAAPLVAIVEHPLIAPDGRLITGTGYDPT